MIKGESEEMGTRSRTLKLPGLKEKLLHITPLDGSSGEDTLKDILKKILKLCFYIYTRCNMLF